MDELPNDLRAVLDLARDAHDPPDDVAKQRVRIALATAIGAPSAGALLTGGKAAALGSKAPTGAVAKTGWAALGGKLTAAAVGTVAVAGIGIAAFGMRTPTPTSAPIAVPTVQEQAIAPAVVEPPAVPPAPAPAPAVLDAAPVEASAPHERRAPKAHRAAASADTLSDETALLRSASEALARGDQDAALAELRAHAKRYPHGSLREERDGLRAIAECTRDSTPSQDTAERFTRLYPNSVLAARVAAACRPR